MRQTHELYLQAEIDTDPMVRQQRQRAHARWQRDFNQLGRGKTVPDEAHSIEHMAFLGYN